jgi:hypothetical protein
MPYNSISALPDYIKAKPAAKQHQWRAVWNSSYSSCISSGGDAKKCEGEAFAKANGVIKGAEMSNDTTGHQIHHDGMMPMQLEKAASQVKYRTAEAGADQTCGSCRFFDAECMKCDVVEGTIDASWVCNLWTAQIAPMLESGTPSMEMYREPTFQVFVEAGKALKAGTNFSEPQWVPFLPKPGKYQHPKYGEVVVTPGQNRELVESVKTNVYQESIPIDAEHETKLSGAVGWLSDMRMNEDGSADAFIGWTIRGQQLLSGGQFKFISPEWFSDWRDPGTGVVHRNVVAGGAITTRPFFKERMMRALVASETGTEVINSYEEDTMPDPKDTKTAAEGDAAAQAGSAAAAVAAAAAAATKTFTEDEVKTQVDAAVAAAKAESAAGSATFAERMTAAEALATEEKKAREVLEAKLAERDKKDRHQRFTDLAAGVGGANDGGRWMGDSEKHISILEKMADQFGEDDATVTTYIEQQNAIAAQFKETANASLFREYGSSASAAGSDTDAKIDAMTKKLMSENKDLTFSQAFTEVMETPEAKRLYAEGDKSQTARGA